jgi:hypothetical protein
MVNCSFELTTHTFQGHSSLFHALIVIMDSEIKYLLSLDAVRDRAKIVGEAAEAGKLSHFDVHEERLSDVADFVVSVIKVCVRNVSSLLETVGEADEYSLARLWSGQIRHHSASRTMAAFRSRQCTSYC